MCVTHYSLVLSFDWSYQNGSNCSKSNKILNKTQLLRKFYFWQMHVTYSPLIYSTTELCFKQNDDRKTSQRVYFQNQRECECGERERERFSRAEIDIAVRCALYLRENDYSQNIYSLSSFHFLQWKQLQFCAINRSEESSTQEE